MLDLARHRRVTEQLTALTVRSVDTEGDLLLLRALAERFNVTITVINSESELEMYDTVINGEESKRVPHASSSEQHPGSDRCAHFYLIQCGPQWLGTISID